MADKKKLHNNLERIRTVEKVKLKTYIFKYYPGDNHHRKKNELI